MAKRQAAKVEKLKPVIHTKNPLYFTIREDDLTQATCKNPQQCVVARALTRAVGDPFVLAEVGITTTRIIQGNPLDESTHTIYSYRTPPALARGIRHFDKTKKWSLPVGEYQLQPWHSGRSNHKSHKTKKSSGKLKRFGQTRTGERVVRTSPTRKVIRIDGLTTKRSK